LKVGFQIRPNDFRSNVLAPSRRNVEMRKSSGVLAVAEVTHQEEEKEKVLQLQNIRLQLFHAHVQLLGPIISNRPSHPCLKFVAKARKPP